MFDSVYIHSYNIVTPVGNDLLTNWQSLMDNESAICINTVGNIQDVYVSKINDDRFNQPMEFPQGLTRFERLLYQAIAPLLQSINISTRTAFILSTTKGNVSKLNKGVDDQVYLYSSAQKLAVLFGFESKPIVVSNACVSGLSAVALAKRLIQMGQYDDALIVAGDEVSEFVLSGFQSFQAVSDQACKPFDATRNGVTLGEAAAAVFVSKEQSQLQIVGEASIGDANHISGPSRTGEGLYRSIMQAFSEARISADQVDFVSAHGTATLFNDEMEAIAFNRAGLSTVPVNSLKGYYGHTLGAAGLLELIISCESLLNNTLIASQGFETLGVSQPLHIITSNRSQQMKTILKTASGFGGSNAAMLVKKI